MAEAYQVLLENIRFMIWLMLGYFVVHVLGDEEGYCRRHASLDEVLVGNISIWDNWHGDLKE